MPPFAPSRASSETSDAVGLVIALLVRHPQLATIGSNPGAGTVTLSFAVRGPLGRGVERELRDLVGEHVRTLLQLGREEPGTLTVACEPDPTTSFVRITRDARTLTRAELQLLVALLSARFAERLIVNPPSDEDGIEDDPGDDDLVDYALDALRDPAHERSLVGFREEKRVLVYFVPARKKKARAR